MFSGRRTISPPIRKKCQKVEEIHRAEHTLAVANTTIGRIEDWLNLPATTKKSGMFDKEKIMQEVSP